ncbi:uncharacterized protein [Rutidosis leptorrhynchoides]|uniref:uncharacterized protein n=1 Tax=Rutidosis leptorrhynchoides TaxID=125765 RepID=UPI003A99D7A1
MAETGSPQFMAACLPTSSASGVLHNCPFSRSFLTASRFESTNLSLGSYWAKGLYDLKQSGAAYPFHHRRFILNIYILHFCIEIQMWVVMTCKILAINPAFLVFFISHFVPSLKRINEPQVEESEDLRKYVLQLQDDMELPNTTVKQISKSLDRLIQKVQKKQPNILTTLISESSGIEGVGMYVNHHIPSLLTKEYRNSWGLSLVTMTTIAISLPNIQKKMVNRLLRGVSKGLTYVALVEESLNATNDYLSIQKAAKTLWLEVTVDHMWLQYELQTRTTPQTDSTTQILHRFNRITKKEVIPLESTYMSISADLMYRITETILRFYNTSIYHVSREELFARLSSMISDILAACLTNLPQLIVMKCHTSRIDKREACVRAAAQLLGETKEIITILQGLALPESLDQDDLLFIDKWVESLNHIP